MFPSDPVYDEYIHELPNPEEIVIRIQDGARLTIHDRNGELVRRIRSVDIHQASNDRSTATLTRQRFNFTPERGIYDPTMYEQECTIIKYEVV